MIQITTINKVVKTIYNLLSMNRIKYKNLSYKINNLINKANKIEMIICYLIENFSLNSIKKEIIV